MQGEAGLQARFAEAMGELLGPEFPGEIGLAVSGGGDSMAMLTLAHNWTRDFGVALRVVTVDHRLREGSGDEAAFVARECAALGHRHDILTWQGWDGRGNLQDAARQARLALIESWRGGLRHVLMAHTMEDQAETFLLRLARGSGVDGLAGIAPRRFVSHAGAPGDGFWLLRPLLGQRREELRHYLKVLQGQWVEDPSNLDDRFDRVRMRRALADLEPLGLGVARLAETAAHMARAREALRARAAEKAEALVRAEWGDLLMARDGLATLDSETRLRLLAGAVQYVSAQIYRPRAKALEVAAEKVMSGGTATLHGCVLRAEREMLRICREFNAVQEVSAPVGGIWDGRARLFGDRVAGQEVRALGGDGARQLPERPESLPYQSLVAQPAVFDAGGSLIAFAPAGFGPPHEVDMAAGLGRFHSFLQTH